jgi:hypothetical protein
MIMNKLSTLLSAIGIETALLVIAFVGFALGPFKGVDRMWQARILYGLLGLLATTFLVLVYLAYSNGKIKGL